jgi:ADP-heptose:LPS heptosyltransferase
LKILITRFLGLGDVIALLLPAVRLVKRRWPHAQVDVLTYGGGAEIMALVPEVGEVLSLPREQWPGELFPAIDRFMALAPGIVERRYDRIICLDTWFMPCFLAQVLRDIGQPVEGNHLRASVAQWMAWVEGGTLQQQDFERDRFLASTFRHMREWFTPWWTNPSVPAFYPAFFLNHCCGFEGPLDFSLPVEADEAWAEQANGRPIVAVSSRGSAANKHYPHHDELVSQLKAAGCFVWSQFDKSLSLADTLRRLKSTHLLISVATSSQWLARSVGCPTLLLPGPQPPQILGAEWNVPIQTDCQYCYQHHCPQARDFACLSVPPGALFEQAVGILRGQTAA